MENTNLQKKFLIRAHTILGLFAIFLFYISTYFGSITVFLPYVKSWELPSRHYISNKESNLIIDNEKLDLIVRQNNLNISNVQIDLPTVNDNVLKISSKNQNTVYLNPYTKENLDISQDSLSITSLFNKFHSGENIPYIGLTLMGVTSIIMIFLMISGFIVYLIKKRKNKFDKQNNNIRFKWHKNFGFLLTPYVIIFSLTGAFLGFMLSFSTPFALSTTNFEKTNMRPLVAPIIFKQKDILEKTNNKQAPLELSKLYKVAKENYPNLNIKKINIFNYNLDNSQTMFSGNLLDNRAISSSRINPMYILLDSKSGTVLEKKELNNTHGMKKTLSLFYWLHFQTDEKSFLRVLTFIFGIIMLICLLFGYLLWAEKKLNNDSRYYELLNRFSIALMLGIIPSSAVLMTIHWILPISMFDRIVWMEGLFYVSWSFYLFYAFKEVSILKILKTIFLSSSILFLLACFLHEIKTDIFLFELFELKLYSQFLVDLTLIFFSIIFYLFYKNIEKSKYCNRFEQKVLK